jgi:type IV pilus assembly protein PilE
MQLKSFSSGVTLIELLVVVSIIGVLAAIAYPNYTRFMQETNRSDATKTLMLTAQSLQRCYSQNYTYIASAGTPCNIAAGANPSPGGFYTITVAIPTAQTYTLTAAPLKAPQTTDAQCASFTLNSDGSQSAKDSGGVTNPTVTKTCWGST